jgi:hypothetical protein
VVVVRDAEERDAVADEVDGRDGVLDDRPREGDKQPVLDHARHVHRQRRRLPHEQEHRQVKRERAEAVGPEHEHVGARRGGGGLQPGQLDEAPGHGEEGEAAGRDVVERGDGVEQQAPGREQDLDEHEPGGLRGDGGELERDAEHVEPRLAVRRDGDPGGDAEHVEHGGAAERVGAEGHGEGVDGDRHQRLEHLDEGDGEVDVRRIGEPERQRVQRINRRLLVGSAVDFLLGSIVDSCRQLLLRSTVGSCRDRPSAQSHVTESTIKRTNTRDVGVLPETCWKLTASCKVSSANGNWTRRFGAAERHTFSVFLIAI